jgi:hypothetical protein
LLRRGRASSEELSVVAPDVGPWVEECAVIREAIEGSDSAVRTGLAALRRHYDTDHDMTAVLGGRSVLTPVQNEARDTARIILRLVDEIEEPYRRWLSGDDEPPPNGALWADEVLWKNVDARGGSDALSLRFFAQKADGWLGVHEWQRELARLRDAEPLERNGVGNEYATVGPPRFALDAVESLFDDGLLESGAS